MKYEKHFSSFKKVNIFRESSPFLLFPTARIFAREREGGSSAFAFCAFGHSARVSMTKGRVPQCCCNSKFSSKSDTTNVDMKTGEGVKRNRWGEEHPLPNQKRANLIS